MTNEANTDNNQLKFNVDLQKIRENKLFVATPMYGGQCFGSYAKSMMNLSTMCLGYQIPMKSHFMYNESLVQRARNYCADEFLRSDCNQMIFIDSDIEFSPEDVLILADLQNKNPEYDVICAPYPKKVIAWEKIVTAVERGFADNDPTILQHFTGDYVFNAVANKNVIKLNEPSEVSEAGTGFMMIRRETFEKFKEVFPEKAYKPDHIRTKNFDGSRQIHAFFDCVIDPDTNRYLSEDYYFCKKVREAGMKVWIAPWMELSHSGFYTWNGSVRALAAIGENVTVDPTKIKKKQ